MRLLSFDDRGKLSLTRDLHDNIPRYAILSHTWGSDEDEITFADLQRGPDERKAGYAKIQFCGEQARRDDLEYFWVDTCCIDKANHVELGEAIVSMFRWYADAAKCYVFLSDVSFRELDVKGVSKKWESAFQRSRWFTRGWTLQELLAPKTVEFFSKEGHHLGDKITLERQIHETTQISIAALRGMPLTQFSIDKRMEWAASRETKRKEDKAYCLLGMFDVFMPLIYGEGEHAFIRLKEEIHKSSMNKAPHAKGAMFNSYYGEDTPGRRTMPGEHSHISNWLTATNFVAQQIDILTGRQSDCGLWLLQSAEYNLWMEGKESTIFCPGIPGAGKTMMSAIVMDNLQDAFGKDGRIGIACLFCSYKSRQEQKCADLLAGLMKQLIQKLPAIPENVERLYKSHTTTQTRPAISELASNLESVIRLFPRVFFVVDALDECSDDKGDRSRFIQEILKLQNRTKLNLFATSRHIPSIQRFFDRCLSLEIRATNGDVDRYLDSQMPRLPSCVWSNPALWDQIKAEITAAVNGMFLLAKFHLDSLMDKTTATAIRFALGKLAKGSDALDHAYADAMERIHDQRLGFKELALQVLSWLVCAQRPLKPLELRHALGVELGSTSLDADDLPCNDDIVSACTGLVAVDEESGIIRLVHYTAQEYFERTHMTWFPCAQRDVGRTCVRYLSRHEFESGACRTDRTFEILLQQSPLLDYAAQHWGYHVRLASDEMSPVNIEFLEDPAKVEYAGQALVKTVFPYSWISPESVNSIHLAAHFGLTQLMSWLLDGGWPLDHKDSNGQTAIFWAVTGNQLAAAKLLIERGALNSRDDCRRTALTLAVEYGDETMVKLLLDYGFKPDPPTWHQISTLSWGAAYGSEAAVKLLLEREGNAGQYNDVLWQPLFWAIRFNQVGAVKILLQEEIKLLAHMEGYQQAMELLNTRGGPGEIHTPLDYLDREWVMFTELEEGRKSKTRQAGLDGDTHYRSSAAFFCAASMGFEPVAKLILLAGGVDVNFAPIFGRTPLTEAAFQGHASIVKLLLENGATRDLRDSCEMAALEYAQMSEHDSVAELLR